MLIVASLYYDFFCYNKTCNNLNSKLDAVTPILGLTANERNVIDFLNRGWYDVQDLDMDCFLALFSRQRRAKKDKYNNELACK